ncbi:hypothetical protein SUGI_0306570 [Cryptomeria japonica]|nr:hypothetical protein SUGI_0306570 [Cryptomeria japonica]
MSRSMKSFSMNNAASYPRSRLNGTRSLPVDSQTVEIIESVKKELRRVASWSHYLESYGGEEPFGGRSEWSIDMSQLFIGNKFASGTHSRLYHGIYKQRPVAVKMMWQPDEDDAVASSLEKQFTAEVSLLFQLHHPNIIELVAACKKAPVFCIITEYLPGGSLRAYLHKQEPHSLPVKLILRMALDIARGMQYLHSQGIIHRDLKSENLLLGDGMCVKVADFGVSCLESQCHTMNNFMGTYRWMAPEMIKGKPYTRKVDVYSFGIVLWEILTALTPFQEMTPVQAAFAVSHKNARPTLPTACPPALAHLIKRCWATNADKRPEFNFIVPLLEQYHESLREDPAFLLYYKPTEQHKLLKRFRSFASICGSSFIQA